MDLRDTERVLLCLRYGIGDLIMEMPVLRALRSELPATWIVALGAWPATELLEAHPCVDELVCVQDWGLTHWADPGRPEQREQIACWLARRDFDVIVDRLHAVQGVRDVMVQRDDVTVEADESVQKQVLVAGGTGLDAIRQGARIGWGIDVAEPAAPRVLLSDQDLSVAREFLITAGVTQRPRVALSPVASSDAKRWPLSRLAALADELVDQHGGRLPVFLGPQERVGDELLSRIEHRDAVVPVGQLHLRRVAALLACCDSLVCNDTGLMHLAAAVGTPVVAVFGPTSPSIYLPPGSVAVGGNNPQCPCRFMTTFGPSSCVVAGRCQWGEPGCIARAALDDVRRALHACVAGDAISGREPV